MRISLPNNYRIIVTAHGWRLEVGDGDFIGVYDCLIEAVNAASEHYARKIIATERERVSLFEASDIVTGIKSQFYAAMRGGSPEDYL